MRTIAVMNQKGGVGKTTTTSCLGSALSLMGKRVLLVDLDPQAHLTTGLGYVPDDIEHSIYDVLTVNRPVVSILKERWSNGSGRLDLIPSNLNLAAAEMKLIGMAGRELILKGKLTPLKGYDYIFIDCPPSLGVLTFNALGAATDVLVTLQAEFYALSGLAQLKETIDEIRERVNPAIHIGGVVCVMYDTRAIIHRDMRQNVQDFFGGLLYEVNVRRNIALAEAPTSGKTIYEYSPSSNGARDYQRLAEEFLRRS